MKMKKKIHLNNNSLIITKINSNNVNNKNKKEFLLLILLPHQLIGVNQKVLQKVTRVIMMMYVRKIMRMMIILI